jgi:hypothetical protein
LLQHYLLHQVIVLSQYCDWLRSRYLFAAFLEMQQMKSHSPYQQQSEAGEMTTVGNLHSQ